MPEERTFDIDPEIEALLSELTPADLVPVAPPPDVWARIEQQLADEPAAGHLFIYRTAFKGLPACCFKRESCKDSGRRG